MKRILEPIKVTDERPQRLLWRGKVFQMEPPLERWIWRGRWWIDPQLQGERRIYYRILCHPLPRGTPRVFEIFRRKEGWILSRIVD